MQKTLLTLTALIVGSLALRQSRQLSAQGPLMDLSLFEYNPMANTASMVSTAEARFTVLSDRVIRMEFDHKGIFEDRATVAMVNRYRRNVPPFTSKTSGGYLTIQTSALTLVYQIGHTFQPWTLNVTTAAGATWYYGDEDSLNLLGTVRSLDNLCTVSLNCTQNADIRVNREGLHCAWGVVSKGGWTTVDDTARALLPKNEWFGNTQFNGDDSDIYFFGHGKDYRGALNDFVNIAGRAPMLRPAQLGSWFTRWYDYANDDLVRLLNIFEQNSLPLDILVLDMNWHKKDAWTGYSWDRQLFPAPNDTLAMLRKHGLIVAANLHDAEGINWWEDEYPAMCAAMGFNPASNQTVEFMPLNATYMRSLDDIVLARSGFDLWWIDWQQGGSAGGCTENSLNPTIITNHVRSTDHLRRGENQRDSILARWGGLGGHRYPVGFSGDVAQLSWQCFSYQPYFSITAANVAYGSISHDLVGPPTDHELHVRWMQFGAYSGIMRIHDRGMSSGICYPNCAVVNIWELPYTYFDAIRSVMQSRAALLPYMYTATRGAFDTGVAMTYPLYYDWPTIPDAYRLSPLGNAQYMVGSSMMVALITQPAAASGLASNQLWLPPGQWYDDVFGDLVVGGAGVYLSRSYDLNEVPIFVKAGAIIPRRTPGMKRATVPGTFPYVDSYIYPGGQGAVYALYEDDGESMNYLSGQYANTTLSYSRVSPTAMQVTIGTMTGSFSGALSSRVWRIFLVGSPPLSVAKVNGVSVPYARWPDGMTTACYTYDGPTATAIVQLGSQSTSGGVNIALTLSAPYNVSSLSKVKGFTNRVRKAKRALDNYQDTPYETSVGPGKLKQAASQGDYLSFLSNSPEFLPAAAGLRDLVKNGLKEIQGGPAPPPPTPQMTELIQLWDESRGDMLLCGSPSCVEVNGNYQRMWVEGYQPLTSGSDTATLYDYYSSQYTDNWSDVMPNPPSGYEAAIFTNGLVYSSSTGGRKCLSVWVNPATNDHMTLASTQGMNWARSNGYNILKECVAYVSTQPPVSAQSTRRSSDANQYAQALLESILN